MKSRLFLLRLAMKNLFRHTRRTFITGISIAVGLAMFILIDSLLVGIEEDSTRNLVLYETSSTSIMKEDYWAEKENMPLKHSIEKPEAVIEALQPTGYSAAPRISFSGELIMRQDPYPEDGSMQTRVIAIDPSLDTEVYLLDESISRGRFLEQDEMGVVIGEWLAEDIGADIGSPLTIITRTKSGYFQTIDVEIVGLVNTPNPIVNRTGVYIPLETADYLLEMNGAVTQIDLSFPYTTDLKESTANIQSALSKLPPSTMDELAVVDWKELGKDFVALAAAKSGGTKVILFLVFLIAAVGISNTMLMSVYERIREIGMFRAMGMSDGEIRLAFLMEAGGIGLIGATAGVLLGVLVNIPMVENGIDYSFLMRDFDMGYRITGIARGLWNYGTIVSAFVTGIVLSIVIAFIPTSKALKMQVTDALRFQ
ncbi:MAG TPA: ABC transporter permease [Sediminispirochaeta sp.]|nr:ABC transporter permease [Sediminispirochaeta sp.]